MEYPYFKGLEADRYSFYRVPKALVKADPFQKMSGDAKLLYAVLLDRMSLSIRNGWQDKHGNAYIICTIEEVMDSIHCARQKAVKLVCEQTKKQKPDIVLHDSGVLVAQTIYGFDSSVMKKIEKFLREQKPELLHHQKFLENGTAERAKESGTEQNYNMIDGCVNNNPKKPRIIGNRISVLDRLHIKLEERKQKSQPQQLQQQERNRKS